jgi:PPOX class probable F420-dependent enzyme
VGFRLTDEEAWAFIADAHTGILTTLRRDGRPITLPVWHVALDRRVYISTPSATAKLMRIRHDPRVSFLVETGEAWVDLVAVSFAGIAAIEYDTGAIGRVSAAIAEKYANFQAPEELLPAAVRERYAERTVMRLEPHGRFSSWNNRALIG